MNDHMKNKMSTFMDHWNIHRDRLGLEPVYNDVGYKYTRFIASDTLKTEMFVCNVTGNIYKAASDVAKAKTVRGHIEDIELFVDLLENGTVRHFKRGRKKIARAAPDNDAYNTVNNGTVVSVGV